MTPEIGHILLIVFLVLSFAGGFLPLTSVYLKNQTFEIPIKKLAFSLFFAHFPFFFKLGIFISY